ncbi:MAG: hypothetical protein ACOY0T_09540 [Myxococcota bacterium]
MTHPTLENARERTDSRVGSRKQALPFGVWIKSVPPRVRDEVVARYRASGRTPDDFGKRAAREAMADALTRAEDQLELEHPRWPERDELREVRRRLEKELWP